MFVGYEVKSNQNQAKPVTLANDIKISQAVLDPSTKQGNKKDPVCLLAEYNKKQFIIAVLDPNQSWQAPLDLQFAAGTEIKFFIRGQGTVHLTGYEYHDEMDDLSMSMSSDEDIEEMSDDEEDEKPGKIAIKEKASGKKSSPKLNGSGKKAAKKNGKRPDVGDQNGADDDDEDDDDDSDDSDFSDLEDNFDTDSDAEDEDEEMDDDDDDELGELDEDSDEDEDSDD